MWFRLKGNRTVRYYSHCQLFLRYLFLTHWVCGSTILDLKITQITTTGAAPYLITYFNWLVWFPLPYPCILPSLHLVIVLVQDCRASNHIS